MGWNSFDAYGTSITEAEVRANAVLMEWRLAPYGWDTLVVDIQWSEPQAKAGGYNPDADLAMDAYGRLIPAVNRFPSSQGGAGFKPLADFLHDLGLKFGIHVMRGIPRRAVAKNLPILDSPYRAAEIADVHSVCPWNTDMFGVDMDKPGAQDYYDSLLKLYSGWGVDYLKADDMASPIYHAKEIEALSKASRKCGRPIVLSLSPGGDAQPDCAHLKTHVHLWRVGSDLWDRWEDVVKAFAHARHWQGHAEPGHWPDLDMLPLGRLSIRGEVGTDRNSRLSREEQKSLMTLWAITRSPLMMGGDLPSLDAFTYSLLTNPGILETNQNSRENRELFHRENRIAWTAISQDSEDRYLALFNLGEKPESFSVEFKDLELREIRQMKDLWKGEIIEPTEDGIETTVQAHGVAFYQICPE